MSRLPIRIPFVFLLALSLASAANAAFSNRKAIVVDNTKVTGAANLTNFPVLVSLVDPNLQAKVTSPFGYDIVFRAEDDPTCGGAGLAPCLLDHEIEKWDSASGTLVAWVRVPVLRTAVDTTLYIYYGDPSVTCPQEKPRDVWNTGYREVFHLDETGDHTDSTANGYTAVSKGTVGQNVPGKIGPANEFFGPGESRLIISDVTLTANSPVTFEAWFRLKNLQGPNFVGLLTKGRDDPGPNYDWVGLALNDLDRLIFAFDWTQGSNLAGGPSPLSTNTWYYAAATFDGASQTRRLFLDGLQVASDSGAGSYNEDISQYTRAGDDSNGRYLDGFLDEMRISNVVRTPNWIRTTYNNSSDPATFYAVGAEDPAPPPVTANCPAIEAPCQGLGSGVCRLRSIGTAPNYTTGTVTATFGSAVVVGAGTTWVSANRGRGDRITIDGFNYTVLAVDSETQLRLTTAFTGATGPGKAHSVARKFASPALWENCVGGAGGAGCEGVSSSSLVSDNRGEIGVVYDDGGFYGGSPVVVIDGSVTDKTHTITLTADGSNRHKGFAWTGVVFNNTSSNPAIQIEDDHVTVEWLEVNGGATAGSASFHVQNLALENHHIVVRNNVIHNTDASALRITDADAIADFYDNVVYDTLGALVDVAQPLVRGSRMRVFSNTFYSTTGAGITVASSIDNPWFTFTNNVLFDTVAGFSVPWVNVASRNNLSDDSAPPSGPFTPDLGHSPGGGGVYGASVASASFCDTATGMEDFHIQAGSSTLNAGRTLTLFGNDIDDAVRGAPWDIGADELGGACFTPGSPTLSSAANQTFTVAAPLTIPAAPISITDDPVAPTITAAADLRIRIPSGFPMRFDATVPTVSVSGPAAFKVAGQVKAYEELDRTVVLDVLFDFAPADQITVGSLLFWNFTAPASGQLELEVGNDDLVSAIDDKTLTILPDTFATLSSDDHQVFTQGEPPAFALPFTVIEAESATSITPANDIQIRIPAGYNMTWDPGVTSITVSGPAALKVAPNVFYLDANYTLFIPVITGFAPGEFITVSGLRFQGFTGPSPVANLELSVGVSTDFDDKTIEITTAADLVFFTATARDREVKLEWLAPATGLCDSVLLLRRDDGVERAGPADPLAFTLASPACTLGAKDYFLDDTPPLTNGTLYAYAAFAEYGGGLYTGGKFVKARPVDASGTPVQWAYSTGATAMAPPGLRFHSGVSYVYAVSNDGILHSMNGGPAGGDWPASWKPYELGGPAQARPPVVGFPVGAAAEGAAFLGSQDGSVYAIDARDGREEWSEPISSMVQAAPAGHFLAYDPSAFDLVIAGTRNASAPNELVALDVNSGAPVWSFDNSPAQGGDGKEIGIISGSASIDYPMKRAFFASRTRGGPSGSSRTLWCVDFSSGSPVLRWSLPLGDIDGSPVVWNNTVYVGTNSGILYAVDRLSPAGTIKWSHPIGDGPVKAFVFPQIPTNRVLLSTNGKVTSVEDLGLTYNVSWQILPASIPGPSTPVFVPGTGKILVGSSDGHLYQMDALVPLPPVRVQLGDGSSAVGTPSLDVLTGTIYVGTDEGVIYGVTFPLP